MCVCVCVCVCVCLCGCMFFVGGGGAAAAGNRSFKKKEKKRFNKLIYKNWECTLQNVISVMHRFLNFHFLFSFQTIELGMFGFEYLIRFTNLMEIFLYILAILFVYPFSEDEYVNGNTLREVSKKFFYSCYL